MQHLLPLPSDPVVTRGDFSLDNILLVNGEVVGCAAWAAYVSRSVAREKPT